MYPIFTNENKAFSSQQTQTPRHLAKNTYLKLLPTKPHSQQKIIHLQSQKKTINEKYTLSDLLHLLI